MINRDEYLNQLIAFRDKQLIKVVSGMAINENGTQYYQVAQTVRDEITLNRELAPLNRISDHNPKYLLTLDDDPPAQHNGIRQINAIDWLLGK